MNTATVAARLGIDVRRLRQWIYRGFLAVPQRAIGPQGGYRGGSWVWSERDARVAEYVWKLKREGFCTRCAGKLAREERDYL